MKAEIVEREKEIESLNEKFNEMDAKYTVRDYFDHNNVISLFFYLFYTSL